MTAPPEGTPEYYDWQAARRWGTYIRGREAEAIDEAQAAAPEPRRALDIGCGGGEWTQFLIDRGWSVTAVDVDPRAVEACKARNPKSNSVLVDTDTRRLPAEDQSVSLVICIEVRGVSQSDWFLPEARRVLVPNGRLVTVAWNRSSLRGRFTDAASRIRTGTPHPFYQIPYKVWRRGVTAAGLETEAEQGLCWFPFGRAADSRLIPPAAALERGLGLTRLPTLSPWVLVTASRPPDEDPVQSRGRPDDRRIPARRRRGEVGMATSPVTKVIRPGYVRARSALDNALFDRRYGVDTDGDIPLTELGIAGADRIGYKPTKLLSLRRVLPPREVTDRDVFIDVGSGKGRVVLQAALSYPFRRVYGVELSGRLHDIATRNVEMVRDRLRCPDVHLVRADAREFDLPDDVTVVFFYNPFRGEVFETVVRRLLDSLDRRPRPLRVIYGNPLEEAALMRTGRFRPVRTVRGWRPGREWSRSNSFRLYTAT